MLKNLHYLLRGNAIMKLFKKIKKDFLEIVDYGDLRVGDIVKIYSETSNKFISKHPYFITKIDEYTIYFQNTISSNIIIYDKIAKSIKCA